MHIHLVRGSEHAELITDFKRRCWAECHDLTTSPQLSTAQGLTLEGNYEVMPIAQYLLAITEDGRSVMGMIEAFFLDQMHEGYHEMEPEPVARALEERCPFGKLARIETIYVEPRFRRQPIYAYLCMAMAHLFRELGGQGSQCLMSDGNGFLHRLYQSSGGQLVGTYDNQDQIPIAVYYLDFKPALTHPRLPRVVQNCHFDMDLARDTWNWKHAPQEYEDEEPEDPQPKLLTST